jgi:hypothetical protein
MKLTSQQSTQLAEALIETFTEPLFAAFLFDRVDGRRLDRLSSSAAALDERVRSVIGRAQAEGWLSKLVMAAQAARPDNATFSALVSEYQLARPNGPVNHYDAWLLRGNRALIDRQTLREKLRTLGDQMGSRILVVDGDPVSGKTYSLQLINHLADFLGAFKVVWVDLVRLAARNPTIEPERLARHIAEQMRLNVASLRPKGAEQDATWIEHFGTWLTGELADRNEQWWIVIDHFLRVPLSQQTKDLVEELAVRIDMNIPQLRLVLLSYRDDLPLAGGGGVEREEIKRIDVDDLTNFFRKVYADRGLDPTPAEIAKAIAKVFSQVDEKHERRLEQIGRRAAEVSREIIERGCVQ